MKKNTVNDIKLNTDSVGFQIRESYKKARTNIIYSIVKKRLQEDCVYKFSKI